MNAKQAKRIRAALREEGVDWRGAAYQPVSKNDRTVRLAFECGRAKYRRFKRNVSQSPHPAG